MSKEAEIRELAKKAAKACRLNFQDGGFLGNDWYELVGEGVPLLEELLRKHDDRGLAAFNLAFATILEEQVRKDIKLHDHAFQALLPRVVGAPYDMREIAELQRQGHDTSSLVTTEDYRATVDVRDMYLNFLEGYQQGKQMQVYIPTGMPLCFQGNLVKEPWNKGRLPTGKVIILQKPVKERVA